MELDLLTHVVRRLLAADLEAYRPLPEGASDADRLHRVARILLTLASERREYLPRPLHFLRLAAVAETELALLTALPGTGPDAAVNFLENLQRLRLRDSGHRFRKAARWQVHSPEEHLFRAFWNLAGVASELSVQRAGGGLLDQHAVDTANYLVFAVFTSGAFERAVQDSGVAPAGEDGEPPAAPPSELPNSNPEEVTS